MHSKTLIGLTAVAASLAVCASASAASRAYVTQGAVNIGDCRKSLPCGDINYAINQVDSGGRVIITDSESYPTQVTISKPLTLTASRGERPEIRAAGSNAVTINVATGDDVVLRHIDVRNANKDTGYGVYITSGDVVLDDVDISRSSFTIWGTQSNASLTMRDVRSRRSAYGAWIYGGSGNRVVVEDSQFTNSAYGLVLYAGTATISNSRFAHTDYGLYAQNTVVTNSRFVYNRLYGIIAERAVYVGRSVIAFNGTGYLGIYSYGDNSIQGNAAGDAPPPVKPRG